MKKLWIMLIIVCLIILIIVIYNKTKKNSTYKPSLFVPVTKKGKWNDFWDKVIYGVISVEYGFDTPCDNIWSKGCRGKRYTDVLHLDSGTIGIAHWASGGLCKIYKSMDTQKYFNRSQSVMCDNYADRSSGASDNDWWIKGFQRWVKETPKSSQDKLFIESRQRAVDTAIQNGWKTDREMAIAVGVSNSYGNSGFISKAKARNWDAERIINEYVNKFGGEFSNHKNKRKIQIDKWFPINNQVNIT